MTRLGLGDYVRAAFRVPYNVILLTGGILAGMVSGRPEIVWPLVAAGELLYLSTLSTNARFQAVVRARDEARRVRDAGDPVPRLLGRLDLERRERFERVRRRCIDLQRSLAGDATGSEPTAILETQQLEGVNKLLWVFLRTLVQEQALGSFCATMPRAEIERTLRETEAALAGPGLTPEMQAAHRENVDVLRQRLDNLARAEENQRAIAVRLVRVENSIMLIQEQALTRRDPAFVEAEVKSVTEGLDSVEEMMRSMDLPQLGPVPEGTTPDFLRPGGAERERQRS